MKCCKINEGVIPIYKATISLVVRFNHHFLIPMEDAFTITSMFDDLKINRCKSIGVQECVYRERFAPLPLQFNHEQIQHGCSSR